MFIQFLGEYDWTTRGHYGQHLPDSDPANPYFVPKINTQSALVASMMWARIVSLDGAERTLGDRDDSGRFHLNYSNPVM